MSHILGRTPIFHFAEESDGPGGSISEPGGGGMPDAKVSGTNSESNGTTDDYYVDDQL